MSAGLGVLVLHASLAGVGAILLTRLGLVERGAGIRWLGAALVVGWALFGIVLSVAPKLGATLDGTGLLGAVAGSALAAAIVPAVRVAPPPRLVDEGAWRFPTWLCRGAVVAAGAVLLLRAAVGAADTHWDSWAFWVPKAKALFHFGSLDAPGGFTTFANPEYPPFAPAVEAAVFVAVGGDDTLPLLLHHWLLAAGFVLAVAAFLGRRVPPVVLWASLAALALAPTPARYVLSSLADPQVAYQAGLAFVCGALWLLTREAPYAAITGVFLVALALTKTEGFFLALILCVSLASAGHLRRGRLRTLGLLTAAPVAALLAWKLWLAAHDQPLSAPNYSLADVVRLDELVADRARLSYAAEELARLALAPSRWALVVPLFLVAVAVVARRDSSLARYAGTWFGLSSLGLASVYWISDLDVRWYVDTSADRVLLPILTTVAVATPLLLAEALGDTRTQLARVADAGGRGGRGLVRAIRSAYARAAAAPLLVAAGLGACVAFVLLRAAFAARFPPFLDEATYGTWALQMVDDPGQIFVSLANGKEPLLPWLGAIGIALGAEPLAALRAVSLLSGAVVAGTAVVLAYRLGGALAAAATALVAAVLPYTVVHDAIGIYDPLAAATAAVALLALVRLSRKPSLGGAVLLGVALGAGLLTKQTAYVSLALLPTGVLLLDLAAPGRFARVASWAAHVVGAVALAVAIYSVLALSEHYAELARVRELIYPTHSAGDALRDPSVWIERNWPPYRAAIAGYLTPPLVGLLAVGAALSLGRVRRSGTIVLAWCLAPLAAAVLLVDEAFPRYLATAVAPALILIGLGAAGLARLVLQLAPGRRGQALVVVGAVLALLPALRFDAAAIANPAEHRYPALDDEQYARGWPSGAPWVDAAERLREFTAGEPAAVLMGERGSDALRLLLWRHPTLRVARGAPDGWTRWGVTNGVPFAEPAGAVTWREVERYPRPRGGPPVVLYEYGVHVQGHFATTPDALREALGLTDAGFDAVLARDDALRAWYLAWYEARA